MKIRNGFVSNSSSSSFVVRGTKVKKEELAKLLKVDIKELDWKADDKLFSVNKGFCTASTRYYFGGEEQDDIIIGMRIESNDGKVTEVPDDSMRDVAILEGFEKMGLLALRDITLSTFFRYISNDNYWGEQWRLEMVL